MKVSARRNTDRKLLFADSFVQTPCNITYVQIINYIPSLADGCNKYFQWCLHDLQYYP